LHLIERERGVANTPTGEWSTLEKRVIAREGMLKNSPITEWKAIEQRPTEGKEVVHNNLNQPDRSPSPFGILLYAFPLMWTSTLSVSVPHPAAVVLFPM
jgi:hypothetical protein